MDRGQRSRFVGRRLITTDILNQRFSTGPYAFYRADLPLIYYRAKQGGSNDDALTSKLGWLRSAASSRNQP